MSTLEGYKRMQSTNRNSEMIEVKSVGKFPAVICKNIKSESETINGCKFESFHQILGTSDQTILTAFKSKQCPDVLLIVWRDFPFTHHIEQGGDLMIQEMVKNGIKHLLIDNTYVQSGWMNDKIGQYFDQVWYPSLIQLQLQRFAHIQSLSALGGNSFQKFKEDVSVYLNSIGNKMQCKVFDYLPVEVKSEATRSESLSKGLELILS